MSDINVLYLSIPYQWSNTYYKLLYLLAYSGKNIIDDCNYLCNNKGNNVFTCWNLFQSAIAANELGETKKAELFIDYVDKQLDCYIRNDKITLPTFNTDDYPKLSLKPNGNDTYTLVITYKDYIKEIQIPESGIDLKDVIYYGVTNSNNVEDIDLTTLTKESYSVFGKTLEFTTTKENDIICFISPIPLVFVSAGLPLTCNMEQYDSFYYYTTDRLLPSKTNIIINKA